MTDMTKNRVIYSLLTDEEKAVLKEAEVEGQPIVVWARWGWNKRSGKGFYSSHVYRIAPAQAPHVPDGVWRVLNPKWRWVAWDKNGLVYVYSAEPEQGGDRWHVSRARQMLRITDLFPTIQRGTVPWNETLVQRPEGL